MTKLELFNTCTRGPWITAGIDIQYKVENRVLYLQCSHGFGDWLLNMDAFVVPYKHMNEEFYVHRGYLRAWKSIQEETETLSFDSIVGYSHGAGLALFIHENFWFIHGWQPATVVFGCPKVFFMPDTCAIERMSAVARYTSEGDWVTFLPPFYRHVGHNTVLCKRIKRPAGQPILPWVSKHAPECYRLRLE